MLSSWSVLLVMVFVGRGVLLDISRLRGASWLEPGDHVLRKELMATSARDLAPWSSV
jgi:hypothetical protein